MLSEGLGFCKYPLKKGGFGDIIALNIINYNGTVFIAEVMGYEKMETSSGKPRKGKTY